MSLGKIGNRHCLSPLLFIMFLAPLSLIMDQSSKGYQIIIIITRPRAHTTKYNHQWDNLQMGACTTVHDQRSVWMEKMHIK